MSRVNLTHIASLASELTNMKYFMKSVFVIDADLSCSFPAFQLSQVRMSFH
jgi:hypothetical protein